MTLRELMVAAVVLAACDAPPVAPGADQRQQNSLGRIEGSVVVNSAARGNLVVLLYDAARPPPPAGTGHPLAFTVVAANDVFGVAADGATGPFVAPFTFSLVPPGQYLLRGFIDANADFIPWYGVTADVNRGDVGGAAIDLKTGAPLIISVTADADGGTVTPALGVAVSFSDSARVPIDRPVFSAGAQGTVQVGAAPLPLELTPLPVVEGLVLEGAPAFLAQFLDVNGDGVPDDLNGDGVPDLKWPKIVVRKIADGDNPLVDENDLDRNGILDDTGADYVHLNPTTGATVAPDGKPDLVVLAAIIDPTDIAGLLVDGAGHVLPAPVPVPKLKLVLLPRALDASTSPMGVLAQVPRGQWAITIIQATGQTWRVPNELAQGIGDRIGLPVVGSQGFVVTTP